MRVPSRLAQAMVLTTLIGGTALRAADEPSKTLFQAVPFSAGVKVTGGHGPAGGTGPIEAVPPQGEPPAITIAPESGAWDLSQYASVVFTVENPNDGPITVGGRAENASAKGLTDSCGGAVVLLPGEEKTLRVRLIPRPEDPGFAMFEPFYMYVKAINVRENTVDPSSIARLVVAVEGAKAGETFRLRDVKAVGAGKPGTPKFLPFIDSFGQYVHADWPGKIDDVKDFAERRAEELKEMADWPGPKDVDQYGGWTKGPTLKATGSFRVQKVDGKWWLVDPLGKLFWSYGPTGVGFGGDISPITDRENWFTELPKRDDPKFGEFYTDGQNATYRYYQTKKWTGYSLSNANLVRKYGDGYKAVLADLSNRRLKSWGFNTIASWSAGEVIDAHQTAYCKTIHYGAPLIHYRMPDAYSGAWEPNVRKAIADEAKRSGDDPFNIGYFVDNERWWGPNKRGSAIGVETMKNAADCAAKIKFIAQLRKKYSTIEKLNQAWETKHETWDALAANREAPNTKVEAIQTDCGDFGMMFAERYFSVVGDAIKKSAPGKMYMGCRFHGHVDIAVVELASKYADLISYNIYDNPPTGRVNNYRSLDVPIMITEWGVESDRRQTPFRPSMEATMNPLERTQLLTRFVDAACKHPNVVGAHFFQYRDQPLSGRPDGEATLRGFVNVADTPSFELIQANRRVAYDLYEKRSKAK